ncbi:hypothetical protein I551_7907 [Mycobacterium ulcerans str. Harvey]|uniref:Uncharacterized protein n=1 Tax=Mycobacterium ulcerans str. Harvey TaxID=1299332 RepID=A0ABP3A871_MYCUL|nr:hypothetical protein I551_7907 [Mycobacterium ulcerans str. Harvey]
MLRFLRPARLLLSAAGAAARVVSVAVAAAPVVARGPSSPRGCGPNTA